MCWYNFEITEREDVNINQKWRKLYFQKESIAKQTGEIHLNFPSIDYCKKIPEYNFFQHQPNLLDGFNRFIETYKLSV